jgi:hypothetical protein
MLRSVKKLYGKKLRASEGGIGHLDDFYICDHRWIVRYVAADTGSWLPGRSVLLSPHAFGYFRQEDDCLPINLTMDRMENSPALEGHKPVSRQFEEEYFRYYGWPCYWQGGEIWGITGRPAASPSPLPPARRTNPGGYLVDTENPHLRSTKAMHGYHIETPDGPIGSIVDFMLEEKTWVIRHLVVESGHWLSGMEIALSPKHIESVSDREAKVFVNVTREIILDGTEYHVPRLAFHDSRRSGY